MEISLWHRVIWVKFSSFLIFCSCGWAEVRLCSGREKK